MTGGGSNALFPGSMKMEYVEVGDVAGKVSRKFRASTQWAVSGTREQVEGYVRFLELGPPGTCGLFFTRPEAGEDLWEQATLPQFQGMSEDDSRRSSAAWVQVIGEDGDAHRCQCPTAQGSLSSRALDS